MLNLDVAVASFGSLPDTGKVDIHPSLSWHVKVEIFKSSCLQRLVILTMSTSLLLILLLLLTLLLLLLHPPLKRSLPLSYAGKCAGEKKL